MTERRISLDGLRGIAVILVFLYHHGLLNIGWAGVDLFFVLSGFLITTILRKSRKDYHFWKGFWIKRVTRIVPPLIPLLVVVVLLDHSLLSWVPGYVLSFGDVIAYLRPNYEDTRPLWSLAVEEHFYLLWPFAVRFLQRRALMAVLLVIIMVEPLLRAFMVTKIPDWQVVYFLTPFRLDAISLGSLLSLLLESSRLGQFLKRIGSPGLLLTVAIFVSTRLIIGVGFGRGSSPFYNALVYSLVAFAAFFLISGLITNPGSLSSRFFSWPPLVFLGTISYGLYLYQVPCRDIALRLTGVEFHRIGLVSWPLTVLAAWLSFQFYEKPLILWGKRRAANYRPQGIV